MDLRIFSCFDTRHDRDLHARLVAQTERPGSPLRVVDGSGTGQAVPGWEEELRVRLADADAVVVICGEHTDTATGVSRELSVARQEGKPYVLLWGRRERACTRPEGARAEDSFFTWIFDVLTARLAFEVRSPRPAAPSAKGATHESG